MAKENLSIEDLIGREVRIVIADSDRILFEAMDGETEPSNEFIILSPAGFTFKAAYLKEVKTKS